MLVFLPLVEQLTGIESNKQYSHYKKSSSKFTRAFLLL